MQLDIDLYVYTHLGQTHIVELFKLQTIPFPNHSSKLAIKNSSGCNRRNGHSIAQEEYYIFSPILIWRCGQLFIKSALCVVEPKLLAFQFRDGVEVPGFF